MIAVRAAANSMARAHRRGDGRSRPPLAGCRRSARTGRGRRPAHRRVPRRRIRRLRLRATPGGRQAPTAVAPREPFRRRRRGSAGSWPGPRPRRSRPARARRGGPRRRGDRAPAGPGLRGSRPRTGRRDPGRRLRPALPAPPGWAGCPGCGAPPRWRRGSADPRWAGQRDQAAPIGEVRDGFDLGLASDQIGQVVGQRAADLTRFAHGRWQPTAARLASSPWMLAGGGNVTRSRRTVSNA